MDEPDKGKTQGRQPIVDRLHYPSAEPGQTGRDGTGVPWFFSMEITILPDLLSHKTYSGSRTIKNPVLFCIRTGFI